MHTPLIDALENPEVYPHAADRIERIETHISWVLLAGAYAYKIKKPLDLGFLDFSTLERRRFFCAEELRLNRRTAPGIYLDLIRITGTGQRPELNGRGPTIEYAVRMRRFDREQGFDRLVQQGRLTGDHVRALALELARLHRTAESADPHGAFGRPEQVAAPIRETFETLKQLLGETSITERLDDIGQWIESSLRALRPLLAHRRAAGFIRECHGDAHLGNVTLFNGQATLFDCIEFSEALRWIDTASDLAFTVMDLRAHDAAGLSWALLDEYLAATGDFDGMGLLRLYMVYRALVRAKVGAIRRDEETEAAIRDRLAQDLGGYLGLAEELTASPRPALLITMGVSGSGKSWLAERLVEQAGMIRLRSDVERKRIHGLAPDADSASETGAGLYSRQATERTYDHLATSAGRLLGAGFRVLVDATFLDRDRRNAFRRLAAQRDVPFGIVACDADDALLRKRITRRAERGDDPSEAGLKVLEHQRWTLQPLEADELEQALKLDTEGDDTVERAAAWIHRRLGRDQRSGRD